MKIQQQTTNNKQYNNGLNFKKLALCTALLAGLSVSATANTYVWNCNIDDGCENTNGNPDFVHDTKVEGGHTNTYKVGCQDNGGELWQPTSITLSTSSSNLDVYNVGYCTDDFQFTVNNNLVGTNSGFSITNIDCNNDGTSNTIHHNGFSSASDWNSGFCD